jgi:hypothetical protein
MMHKRSETNGPLGIPLKEEGCGTSKVGCTKAILGESRDDEGVPRWQSGERQSFLNDEFTRSQHGWQFG